MDLLEYQARELFRQAGLPLKQGLTVSGAAELAAAAPALAYPVVVKAQVQTGGRGKAGGVRFADTPEELLETAEAVLGLDIGGYTVRQVMAVEKVEIVRELYLSILLDRDAKHYTLLFSPQGGVDVEQTARARPEQVSRLPIDPLLGLSPAAAVYLGGKAGFTKEQTKQLGDILLRLYACVRQNDCLLAEINPLAVQPDGSLIAVDAKVRIDDSALARLPQARAWRDAMPTPALVREAREYSFLYIPCEPAGDVVVMSNGSGMLMSCIDQLARHGRTVSAVLDLGGGATADRISHAVRILFSTEGSRHLFINIFGGITRCNEVAAGIRAAVEAGESRPMVVRMEGTNKAEGLKLLQGLANVVCVDGLAEGVAAIVEGRDAL